MGTTDHVPPATAAEPERHPSASAAAPAPAPVTSAVAPTAAPPSAASHDGLLRSLAAFGANVTVLTALLVYFGGKRADTQAAVLGVDESVFGLSTQDYLLRSVDALFVPIGIFAAAGLGWLWAHDAIRSRIAAGDHLPALRRAARALGFAWVALPLVAVGLGLRWPQVGLFAFPLSFGLGALLTAYGLHLRRLVPGAAGDPGAAAWQVGLTKGLVAVVVTLSVFWAVTNFATVRGAALGRRLPEALGELTGVVVYSPQRLNLDAPGVVEESLAGGDAAYRFRYRGLRLLDHTGSRFFLVSDGWTPDYGVVVVIDDDDPVRLEFVRDRRG
ncbi:MAG: hypothetical protein H0V19_03440 [Euzebyales bacterium]|nr:hypothetical protein [Euzebyales bacterium]